jgi:hypothetical protein
MKRLTITVLGHWTCNDGRGWIARRKTDSHIIISAIVISMASHINPIYDKPFFEGPRIYGPGPCPPVETVLAEVMGFEAYHLTNQRDYARAARDYIKIHIDSIPFET